MASGVDGAAGLSRAQLVGHSMGGSICMRVAAERPGAVDRLVLAAPAGVPSGRSRPGYLVPLLRAARHRTITTPGFLPVLAHDALSAGPLTLWRAAQELLAEDVRGYLPRITAPTLIVRGEHDPLIPASHAALLRECIPDARLVTLTGAGHVPMFDRP